ncbi:hypothetical protein FRC10_001956 [Ceratobasidium sp. 414]|nr:hypothetical protein FRC10_001956 [Ceratobasidium sp. 414]
MPELLKPPVDLELAFAHCARVETSPRCTEANWNLLWDMKLQQEIARIGLPNFTYTNQLPLVLRNAVSTASTDPNTADTNNNDNISDDTGSGPEDEEDSDADDSPTKPKSRKMEHNDRAYHGKKPTGRLAFVFRSQTSPASPIDPKPALAPAPLTPINPKSRPVDPPNTDQSIPARRGEDQFFYVDYALISLALDPGDKPLKTLMGFKDVSAATGNAPTLIELKRCISRTQKPDNQEAILGRRSWTASTTSRRSPGLLLLAILPKNPSLPSLLLGHGGRSARSGDLHPLGSCVPRFLFLATNPMKNCFQ